MLGKRNHRASLSGEALKIRVHFGCAENTETTCSEVGAPKPAMLGGRTNAASANPSALAEEPLGKSQQQLPSAALSQSRPVKPAPA